MNCAGKAFRGIGEGNCRHPVHLTPQMTTLSNRQGVTAKQTTASHASKEMNKTQTTTKMRDKGILCKSASAGRKRQQLFLVYFFNVYADPPYLLACWDQAEKQEVLADVVVCIGLCTLPTWDSVRHLLLGICQRVNLLKSLRWGWWAFV